MLLRKVTPRYFGPFSTTDQSIEIEADVTVLTGANDSGKSFLLRLIELVCGYHDRTKADHAEYCHERLFASGTEWDCDKEFGCLAVFRVTELSKKYLQVRNLELGDDVEFRFCFAPKGAVVEYVRHWRGNQQMSTSGIRMTGRPHIARGLSQHEIGDQIDMSSPNPLENRLLKTAFGQQFAISQLEGLSEQQRNHLVNRATDSLNAAMKPILGPSMPLEIQLKSVPGNSNSLTVEVRDRHGGYTPLSYRGSGVRRVLGLTAVLLGHDIANEHIYVLLDEPETSLHAEAQHFVRAFIEELAKRPTVQVIYATHSPSMINTMRPASVRLLKRDSSAGPEGRPIPCIKVENRAFTDNFLPVRASLGLSAADSLLFAAVTIVVEGRTDVVCIADMLRKLEDSGIEGFEGVSRLLADCALLDANGDSFDKLCRLVVAHGSRPVVFLDGDKRNNKRLRRLRKQLGDVPVILLPEGMEIEDLVPREDYMKALGEYAQSEECEIDTKSFDAFAASGEMQMYMFTKKIERWLSDVAPELSYRKQEVMRRAVAGVKAESIRAAKLRELLTAIRELRKAPNG